MTEVPQSFNRRLGAGDHDGVESEQKSGEGGGERPEEEAWGHSWNVYARGDASRWMSLG